MKIDDFKPEYLGKMEFYLEALDRDVKKLHENPSVVIILCKSKDEDIVEYALSRNMTPTMISESEVPLYDSMTAAIYVIILRYPRRRNISIIIIHKVSDDPIDSPPFFGI